MRFLAAILGGIVAGVTPASADIRETDLSGRWKPISSAGPDSCTVGICPHAFDFVRCGDTWCGIEVKNGTECGRIAWRLHVGQARPMAIEFLGRFERSEGSAPYAVSAQLHAFDASNRPDAVRLSVAGSTSDSFEAFRRTFPLHMTLKRDGDALCQAEDKSS